MLKIFAGLLSVITGIGLFAAYAIGEQMGLAPVLFEPEASSWFRMMWVFVLTITFLATGGFLFWWSRRQPATP